MAVSFVHRCMDILRIRLLSNGDKYNHERPSLASGSYAGKENGVADPRNETPVGKRRQAFAQLGQRNPYTEHQSESVLRIIIAHES